MAAIEERSFSIFNFLSKIFYSGKFYSRLGVEYQFWGIVYWSCVLFFILFIVHIGMAIKLHSIRSPETVKMIQSFPRVTISEGEVSVNRRLPFKIQNPNDKSRVFVDFLPKFSPQSDATFIVTPNKVLMRDYNGAYNEINISGIENFSINKVFLFNLYNHSFSLIMLVSLPVLWLLLSVISAIVFLALAKVTQFLSGFLSKKCDFKTAYRLSVFACMPVLIIYGIYLVLPLTIPYIQVGLFLILLLYLQFAASNVR